MQEAGLADTPPEPAPAAMAEEGNEREPPQQLNVVVFGVQGSSCKPTNNSKLGGLYLAVAHQLLHRPPAPGGGGVAWRIKRKFTGSCHLVLSEAQGQSIPWPKIGGLLGRTPTPPLLNYSRGFRALCRKVPMVTTLRSFAEENPTARVDQWLPRSFLFYPARPDRSERAAFEAFAATNPDAVWILKPSDGGKGEGIRILSASTDVLQFLDDRPNGSISWVVSEYVTRPYLLPGHRKFDWRLWVLLGPDFRISVYEQGVFRTCSVPYSTNDFNDKFVHLSNHCIQVNSPAYGEHEPTNEMFYDEFAGLVGEQNFRERLLPQAHHVIAHTLLAVRESLASEPDVTGFNSFNVFGFDLMIDADLHVWLIEVNSSPAVAENLLPRVARDLVETQIDAYFNDPRPTSFGSASDAAAADGARAEPSRNGWVTIFDPASPSPTPCASAPNAQASSEEEKSVS